jgi:hypothetical protein
VRKKENALRRCGRSVSSDCDLKNAEIAKRAEVRGGNTLA